MKKLEAVINSIFLKCAVATIAVVAMFSFSSFGQEEAFVGDRIVPILEEPRHRTMHHDDQVYLLDVQINPGDMTLPHTHNAAIMYTFISNGEGPLYGRLSGNTDYVEENFTHEVSNPGPGLFRIIALTNYGDGIPEASTARPEGMEVDAQLENEWFRSYRLTLGPGQETAMQTHHNPTVVVQVTEGRLHVSREDGIKAELDAMGDWAWRDAHGSFKVKNMGNRAVEVVINEARR